MLPSRHIIVSLSLGGGVAVFTQSLFAGLLCLFSGVLIDADHIVDYLINCGLKDFNFKNIYRTSLEMFSQGEKDRVRKIYLIFHAAEIAILLWISVMFTKNIYLLSIALGYTVHLVLDSIARGLKPQAYFISFRMKNDFELDRLVQ